MRRIGLLGGTFDPVHAGHLSLALAAVQEIALDTVLLIPAAQPPHKPEEQITSFRHRLRMVEIAVQQYTELEACSVEGQLPLPSYTIDTIRYLQKNSPRSDRHYFIVGMDAFLDLLSWKCHQELLQRVNLIVAGREGCTSLQQLKAMAQSLNYVTYTERWSDNPCFQDIIFLRYLPEGISSSTIRRQLAGKENVEKSLPVGVSDYIMQHGLYETTSAGPQRTQSPEV